LESLEESRQPHERLEAWQMVGQDPYALCRLVDDGCPHTEPVELRAPQEPYAGGPLPFSPRHTPSLADCYFVLALVHNAERRVGRFSPFPPDNERALIFYYAQLSHASRFSASDQLALDDCLARVEADLRETRQDQEPGPERDQSSEGQAKE